MRVILLLYLPDTAVNQRGLVLEILAEDDFQMIGEGEFQIGRVRSRRNPSGGKGEKEQRTKDSEFNGESFGFLRRH